VQTLHRRRSERVCAERPSDEQRLLLRKLSYAWTRHGDSYDSEMKRIVDRLCEITKETYSAGATRYRAVRGEKPRRDDTAMLDELIRMARSRQRRGKLVNRDGMVSVLDVGAAYGRDLLYLNSQEGVRAVGVDNVPQFINTLHDLEKDGKLPLGSCYKADMRDLRMFENNSFDVVRHNATLLHLPVLPNGIGADQAVAEAFRVLKPNGVLFVSVKEGRGLRYTDTGEGLGPRLFQYHNTITLRRLLRRNGFRVLKTRVEYRQGPTEPFRILVLFAEKPGQSIERRTPVTYEKAA